MQVTNLGKTDEYVYDICCDGTVVNALGMNVMHNTDGINFRMPDSFTYTKDNPYIGKGLNRNTIEGKTYVLEQADIAEFNDLYMRGKMGLGLDEVISANITVSRKNYIDLMDDGSVKVVGNTLKSKKLPIYIEKFLNEAFKMLLHKKGREFIEYYYDYIERIYNMKIPLREIASVGKIKTSIDDYKKACNTYTKAGIKKARQAWYELAIREGLNVNMGDSVYYINTGTKKDDSDIKRESQYYKVVKGEKEFNALDEDGNPILDRKNNPISLTKWLKKEHTSLKKTLDKNDKYYKFTEWLKYKHPSVKEDDVITFNCVYIDEALIESTEETFCDENFEYNRQKYIEMFNKRVRPLFVVFDRKIRSRIDEKGNIVDNIIIKKPSERKVFTDEECELVAGQPYSLGDVDTYDEVMTMEDKEIKFWLSIGKVPTYIEYIPTMNWQDIKDDYLNRTTSMNEEFVQEREEYDKIIASLKKSDITKFIDENTLPPALAKLVKDDYSDGKFISKKHELKLGSVHDIIDNVNAFLSDDGDSD